MGALYRLSYYPGRRYIYGICFFLWLTSFAKELYHYDVQQHAVISQHTIFTPVPCLPQDVQSETGDIFRRLIMEVQPLNEKVTICVLSKGGGVVGIREGKFLGQRLPMVRFLIFL